MGHRYVALTVGSRALGAFEPRQIRKEAALRTPSQVPRYRPTRAGGGGTTRDPPIEDGTRAGHGCFAHSRESPRNFRQRAARAGCLRDARRCPERSAAPREPPSPLLRSAKPLEQARRRRPRDARERRQDVHRRRSRTVRKGTRDAPRLAPLMPGRHPREPERRVRHRHTPHDCDPEFRHRQQAAADSHRGDGASVEISSFDDQVCTRQVRPETGHLAPKTSIRHAPMEIRCRLALGSDSLADEVVTDLE